MDDTYDVMDEAPDPDPVVRVWVVTNSISGGFPLAVFSSSEEARRAYPDPRYGIHEMPVLYKSFAKKD